MMWICDKISDSTNWLTAHTPFASAVSHSYTYLHMQTRFCLSLGNHHLNVINFFLSRIFSPSSLHPFLPSIFFLPCLCCCCRCCSEREGKQSHIRLYTVAWRHAFWFIDLKWPPCCDCCTRLDGERGSGVGVSGWRCMYTQNSRPLLGRGAPFTRSILCPGGFSATVVWWWWRIN